MANDGQIVFEVTADGTHAIANIKDITKAIQQETKNWDKAAEQSSDNISNSFTSMLKKLMAGFSAVKIGKALLDIGKDAIEAASALEEVQNVVDVTFGDNANQIEKWAKNAGTQFGLTETQAKKFTSTMGAMLKSSGMAGDEIVDVSTDLAGLAADMASFYNLDFEEAFSKIRSGISGQTMPLKELGIDMSVATLNAYALSQGIEKTFDKMTQAEQTMLRYQYLMSATADAQGDFARTSDGYANSIRKFETNVESLKTKLGKPFLDVVSQAVGALNGFLDTLLPDESKRTVLDDFADIDLKTEEKLESIRQTAEEARLLTEELDKIGGSKADKAGGKIQQMADDLANINLDQGKAGAVKDFISVLANNIDIISSVQGSSAEEAAAWLEKIAGAANSLDENDAEGWEKLLDSIKEGLPGFENTDFGSAFFASLGAGFDDVEKKSSVLEWAVEALGNKTDKTAEEQAYWLEVCKQLVKTIPGLSSIINTETGEIKGGTDAVKEYIKAWEEGQTKLALLGALEQKESALSSRFADLPGLQLDMAVAERRVRENFKQLKELYKKYGVDMGFDQNGKIVRDFNSVYGLTPEAKKQLEDETNYYETLVENAKTAREAYETQKNALKEAKIALAEYKATIDAMPGSVDAAGTSVNEWTEDVKESAKTVIQAAQDSLTALEDYANGVHDSVEKAVDGIIKGFEKVSKAGDELRNKRAELGDQASDIIHNSKYEAVWEKWGSSDESLKAMEAFVKNGGKLTDVEKEAYEALVKVRNAQIELNKSLEEYSPQTMKNNLQSQIEYMNEYIANLKKAQSYGLSAEFLASLSDGSTESAEYLSQLVSAWESGDEQIVKDVDAKYQEVQENGKEFTDTLTETQLKADETYQSLYKDAEEAVANLGLLPGAAGDNAKAIVDSIAQGVSDNLPEVKSAVDDILAQLDRLAGLAVSFTFGVTSTAPTGYVPPTGSGGGGKVIGEFETGLDRVPFTGFLASLHEGEGILTAEENRIWQRFKNGESSIDYDTIGGVMRDNIKPGGNVYLDGRVVGSVISDQQGKSFRQLQRSGWQA